MNAHSYQHRLAMTKIQHKEQQYSNNFIEKKKNLFLLNLPIQIEYKKRETERLRKPRVYTQHIFAGMK